MGALRASGCSTSSDGSVQHKVVAPWRLDDVTFERDVEPSSACPTPAPAPTISPLPMNIPARQIAPHIAAALLAKPRTELSGRQGEIVDGLKAHCPGYAVMRSLMLACRSVLPQPAKRASTTSLVRTAAALRGWLDRAGTSRIGVIEGFVGQVKARPLAQSHRDASTSHATVHRAARNSECS
jgi:hypothetical protein